jgi:hypothetical protein
MNARLQHRHRRSGTITVRSTLYTLDADGVVEVSAEHARLMLQGDGWKLLRPEPVAQPEVHAPAVPAPAEPEVDLSAMTKDELLELAAGLELDVDRRMSKASLVAAIRDAQGQ